VTALQLYYGPDLSYANLPHAPVKNNAAITINSKNGLYLNMSLTVSNSGSELQQVYLRLYSVVVTASMITDENINTAVNAAINSTFPAVKLWNNVAVQQSSQWNSGNFIYRLSSVGEAYVLVATLTCMPIGEAPSLPAYTEDPCVAVFAALF
jgi:hypothetical protein